VKPDGSPEDTLKAYARIMEISGRILSGEDFATVAGTMSDDPSAKVNQGSLGYFTAMQMVYPFETAAYSMRIGEVSHPVRTRFGYHIIKVMDRRPAQGEVEVSHIMIRTGESKDNKKAKYTIFEVYEQLQGGAKWDDLCKQYSEDPGSKENGGRLRPFGTGAMASVPDFERVAFSLQKAGEVSDPFQTQYGWHVIRLERRIPLPTFEVLSSSLKNRVIRDERTEISKQAMNSKLRKENLFQENSKVKAEVFALADSSLQKGKWAAPIFPNGEKETLFNLRQQSYPVKDFLVYAQKNQRPNAYSPGKYFGQLYNTYVDGKVFELVEKKIMNENPSYRYLLKEYYEGILLFEIMEKEVWNRASEDSIGQRRFYDSHVADYNAGERVKAVLYSSNTNDFSSSLKETILLGDERKVHEFVTLKKVKTESGYYQKGDKAIFDKIPWASGLYSAENNGMYYLAWLKEILPPGPMSFDEARTAIISDYQGNLEKMWLEQLKRKYPVKVNEKGKQYVFLQLLVK
jgi:peptidyl-prolyl cis-trans isomerase SurA